MLAPIVALFALGYFPVVLLGRLLTKRQLFAASTGFAAALSPFCLLVPAAILARRLGWSWSVALGVPFAVPLILCALLKSTPKTLWHGGIRWRDTIYPLETLRAGNVR